MIAKNWKTCKNEREKYQLYLASRERCNGLCERCELHPMDHVHHLTYIRKYHERLEDLQSNCVGCHRFTHGESDVDPRDARVVSGDLYCLKTTSWRLPAVCVGAADIGYQAMTFPDIPTDQVRDRFSPAVNRTLLLIWEVGDGKSANRVLYNHAFCWSMDAASSLIDLVSNWTAKPFDRDDHFDVRALFEHPCWLRRDHDSELLTALPYSGPAISASRKPEFWTAFDANRTPHPSWFPPYLGRPMTSWIASSLIPALIDQ